MHEFKHQSMLGKGLWLDMLILRKNGNMHTHTHVTSEDLNLSNFTGFFISMHTYDSPHLIRFSFLNCWQARLMTFSSPNYGGEFHKLIDVTASEHFMEVEG